MFEKCILGIHFSGGWRVKSKDKLKLLVLCGFCIATLPLSYPRPRDHTVWIFAFYLLPIAIIDINLYLLCSIDREIVHFAKHDLIASHTRLLGLSPKACTTNQKYCTVLSNLTVRYSKLPRHAPNQTLYAASHKVTIVSTSILLCTPNQTCDYVSY